MRAALSSRADRYAHAGMDGLALIEKIRATAAFASVPVIVLTSGMPLMQADRPAGLNIAAFLNKPVRRNELLEPSSRPPTASQPGPQSRKKRHPRSCRWAEGCACCSPRTISSTRPSPPGCWKKWATPRWWPTTAGRPRPSRPRKFRPGADGHPNARDGRHRHHPPDSRK